MLKWVSTGSLFIFRILKKIAVNKFLCFPQNLIDGSEDQRVERKYRDIFDGAKNFPSKSIIELYTYYYFSDYVFFCRIACQR